MADEDRRRYARFYYERFIREYPDIYDNDRLFATWMRFLVGSEKAWPNDPELPRWVTTATLNTLVAKEVLTVTGFHYQLRGYRAERERRANIGRAGAHAKWHANASAIAHANADAKAMHSTRTSTSTSKKKGIQGVRALDARDPDGRVDPARRSA